MDSQSTQSVQPTQSDAFFDFLAWLDANRKQVLMGVTAVAVVAAAIAFYVWHKRTTEAKANDALFAIPGLMQTRNAAPPKGEAFLKVEQEYPNTSAAERAELIGAGFLFSEGSYEKAQAQFQKFISEHPDSELKPQASLGIAASLEAAGKTDEAIKNYKDVIAQYKGKNVVPLASLSLGRIYEAQNKPEEALKLYGELQTPNSPYEIWRSEAIDRQEKLLAIHPDLAGKYSKPTASTPDEQIIEVTTPPEDAVDQTPKVRVLPNDSTAKP